MGVLLDELDREEVHRYQIKGASREGGIGVPDCRPRLGQRLVELQGSPQGSSRCVR